MFFVCLFFTLRIGCSHSALWGDRRTCGGWVGKDRVSVMLHLLLVHPGGWQADSQRFGSRELMVYFYSQRSQKKTKQKTCFYSLTWESEASSSSRAGCLRWHCRCLRAPSQPGESGEEWSVKLKVLSRRPVPLMGCREPVEVLLF